MKELENFLAQSSAKYIVVTSAVHQADEPLLAIAPEPRLFVLDGLAYVAINVESSYVPELVEHLSTYLTVGYEFVAGDSYASLLNQTQVLALLAQEEVPDES